MTSEKAAQFQGGDLETLSLQLLAGMVLKTVGGILKFGAIQRKFKFLVVQGSV